MKYTVSRPRKTAIRRTTIHQGRSMMKMKLAATILGLALISAGGTAFAAMDNGGANYEITLTTGCTIDTTTASTNFGSYPVDSAALTGVAAGSVSVDCTTGTPYMLGMDAGMNWMGSPGMVDPGTGAPIPYNIIANGAPLGDSGLSTVDVTYTESNPANSISDLGAAAPINYTLTADIGLDPLAGLPPATYFDTVTFTVVW